jgi:DNA transposition AAA+ family ATPase
MASQPKPTPDETVDVGGIRKQLADYRAATGKSWSWLADRTGIASGTLSQFGTGGYAGNNARVAIQVAQWFEAEAEQARITAETGAVAPEFQVTKAAREIHSLLHWAKRGKIAVAATSPGFGKTSAARQFAHDVPNTWLATMKPSTAGVATMLAQVLAAMGERDARGSPQMLTARIEERVRNSGGLIIIDDAQHLSEKALEELRGIHDVTGIGVAMLGNAGLLQRLEGGARQVAFAQLFSRVSVRRVRTIAYPEDGVMLGRAWGITDAAMLRWLGELTVKPGGLRGVSMTIELAGVLASNDAIAISQGHLNEALTQLGTNPRGL